MVNRHKGVKGFTMVELLVVLIIVGILAAVATPLYLTNVKRARVSEAVSTMSLIRQAMRDYQIKANKYYDVVENGTDGNIQKSPETGVNVDVGVSQYFSNSAFTVDATLASGYQGESAGFKGPNAVDFVIYATGSETKVAPFGANNPCVAADTKNCAVKGVEVASYLIEMDNSGRVFVSYGEKDSNNKLIWEAY